MPNPLANLHYPEICLTPVTVIETPKWELLLVRQKINQLAYIVVDNKKTICPLTVGLLEA